MKLNEKLKKIRMKNGYTQHRMSELLGVSLRTYQKYEYGTLSISNKIIIRVCDFFNIPIDEFLENNQNEIDLETLKKEIEIEKISNIPEIDIDFFKRKADFIIPFFNVLGFDIPLNYEILKNKSHLSPVTIKYKGISYKMKIYELIKLLNMLISFNRSALENLLITPYIEIDPD